MRIYLSPTELNLFKECMRCGFDGNKRLLGIPRPRSPFPSLPNGIDRLVKEYMDAYRGKLPPELAHLKDHRLMDEQSMIDDYRKWNGGLTATRNVQVSRPTTQLPNRVVTHTLITSGAIDDLLYHDLVEDNKPIQEVVILDIKTKDKEPDDDYGLKYYTTQINTYGYMLQENKYRVAPYAYLWYWWPINVTAGSGIQFGQKLLKMPVNIPSVIDQLDLIASKLPTVTSESLMFRHLWEPAESCGHCNYLREKKDNEDATQDTLAGTTG